MPTYTFRDTVTGLEEDLVMKISQLDEFYKNNPTQVQVIGVPNFVSSTGGSFETKAGDGWKEVLSKVAEAHPTSTVGKRYGKRSMKDIKTRDIVKKYVEKAVKS